MNAIAGGQMNKFVRFAAAALAAIFLVAPSQAADAKKGQALFGRCAACHNAAKGGPNQIGPNLYGIVGRKAGTKPGFSYSAAMRGSGLVWTRQKLNAYIAHPYQVVRGTRMAFAGIPDASQRADLIAYLETLK